MLDGHEQAHEEVINYYNKISHITNTYAPQMVCHAPPPFHSKPLMLALVYIIRRTLRRSENSRIETKLNPFVPVAHISRH